MNRIKFLLCTTSCALMITNNAMAASKDALIYKHATYKGVSADEVIELIKADSPKGIVTVSDKALITDMVSNIPEEDSQDTVQVMHIPGATYWVVYNPTLNVAYAFKTN